MKKLFQFFKQRWVISLLGVIFICLLIWFVGKYIGFGEYVPLRSPVVRLVVILIVVLIWGVNNLRRQMRANKANEQIIDGLAESSAEDPGGVASQSAEEVAVLAERFEQAMAILKKSRGKHGRGGNLYELPWYIIIGPPGCGKTTALINSGLDFPLAERFGRGSVSGVGGTRNCDWWFTNEAIMLDTAGRYTTQDSYAEVDRAAWQGFLELLKRNRKRRPINGVMVAMALDQLMTLSDQERNAHAYAIRQRVQELYKYFGIRFPIYLLLTKSDLVAGFMEFYDDLGHEERRQVWGMTFPLGEAGTETAAIQQFGAEFDLLLQRLHHRLLARLSQERDLRRRSLIYAFPRQLAALKQTLEQFINDVFLPSRFEEPPMLRGVYFTSGTQEGAPIDRLMGSIARTFGLDQQALAQHGGQGRSYFITDLLKRVIIGESQLAGTNLRLERRRAWLQRGAYAGTVALAVVAAMAWFTSYARNRAYVDEVSVHGSVSGQILAETLPTDHDVLAALPAVNSVYEIPGGQVDRDSGTPFLMGLGLYQGDKLGGEARRAYGRVLDGELLPRVMLLLEDQIRDAPSSAYQFAALKAYLLLDGNEYHEEYEDGGREFLIEWLIWNWEQELPRDFPEAERQRLRAHAEALFETQPLVLPLEIDGRLIEDARRALKRLSVEERIYAQIKSSPGAQELDEFTVADAGGPAAQLVFRRSGGGSLSQGIPGLFTYGGFHDFFLKQKDELVDEAVAESWVLGPGCGVRRARDRASARWRHASVRARVRAGMARNVE